MSIHNRTLFYEIKDGVIRFWDWALCDTTLGAMAEPHLVDSRHVTDVAVIDHEFDDIIAKITYIKNRRRHDSKKVLSGGGATPLHGGILLPRTGP